jgi:hypothetical protein
MRLDQNFNLVVPVEQENGTKIYIYSTPISQEVFESYYLVMSKTFTTLYTEGLTLVSGARVAYITMKNIAKELDMWDGPTGVQNGLINEIKRLTVVLTPVESRGWETLPIDVAVTRSLLDEEDLSEVLNCLVFFTVLYRLHKRTERKAIIQSACALWTASITSLDSTAFTTSLTTSSEVETSQSKVVSSVPY